VRCPQVSTHAALLAASVGRGCIKKWQGKPMWAFVAAQMCAGTEMFPCSFLSFSLFKNHARRDPGER
jgi:hypothetical protein